MHKLQNGSKGGFDPGLSRLRVRRSTAGLLRSTNFVCFNVCVPGLGLFSG